METKGLIHASGPVGTWRPRTTLRRGAETFPWRGLQLLYRGSEIPRGSGPPREVRSLRLFGLSARFFQNTWRSRTFPSHESGPEPLPGEQDSGPQGSGCLDVAKDNYVALA